MKRLIHLPQGTSHLGDLLNQDLRSGHWKEFRAAVAFARLSGVKHISQALTQFATTGRIVLTIGVKDLPTTEEALKKLLATVGPSGEVWILHQEKGPTFHPKIYYLANQSQVKVYIGSGNLTEGGLYENYEAFLCNTLDKNTDSAIIAEIDAMLASWATASSICHKLDASLLASLLKNKYVVTEAQANKASRSQIKKQKTTKRPLFGTLSTKKAPHVRSAPTPPTPGGAPAPSPSPSGATSFWFQTGVMTSASRNQLDFSKRGQHGHVGGISLFGISPTSTATNRMITIEYLGTDYYPNKIFYGAGNGTWRIRFSGQDSAKQHLAQISKNNFPQKILVFHRINATKYRLECLPQSQLQALKSRSIWTDQNPGANGREYGQLT